MAEYRQTIVNKDRIHQELIYAGEVFRYTMHHKYGSRWESETPAFQRQFQDRYPGNIKLHKLIEDLECAINPYERAMVLGKLTEYEKEMQEVHNGESGERNDNPAVSAVAASAEQEGSEPVQWQAQP